ncbi:MAG TPA: hypothetical protein VKP60_09400 [Magnetospirillaceae bacterium]|nr:hypothetical protein [Magnetospirillaceae bacterium]
MRSTLKQSFLAAAACLVIGAAPLAASADEHWHHEFHEHEFARFAPHDREVWLGGHWHHEWHNGRFGWWWFAGGAWYFYDAPVWPYPTVVSTMTYVEPAAAPPPPAATAAPTYYYCDNPAGYYPYVQTCPTPWRQVPAAAPPPGSAPPPPPQQ